MSEWAPDPLPPPPIVIAGMPRLIGRLESVLDAPVGVCSAPSAFDASSAVRTMGESSVCSFAPIGRMPIVSNFTAIFAGEFGHRLFSAATPASMALRIRASAESRFASDSDRMSTSIDASPAIELTDVPPFTMPTVYVVFGLAGT